MSFFHRHLSEVKSTIKLEDIEEKYDIYFSRFFGLFIARFAKKLALHPNHVSIASLLVGVSGGLLLYFQDSTFLIVLAITMITVAGIFDSADGQLARMTGQSSELGRIVDGVIDTFVFLACYIGGIAYLFASGQTEMIYWGLLSAYFFAVKAATYEFYKSEYLRLVGRSITGHIPYSIGDVKRMGNRPYHYLLYGMDLSYVAVQLLYSTRSKKSRNEMGSWLEDRPDIFISKYRELNRGMMNWWAWVCGLNVHRNGIVFFSLLGRFDLYIYASLFWMIAFIPLSIGQYKQDKKLLAAFG